MENEDVDLEYVETPVTRADPIPRTGKQVNLMRMQRIWGFIFISPWIIGFFAFIAIPMVAALVFSFSHFQLNKPDEFQFVGLDNYRQLFNDRLVGASLLTTLKFAWFVLPIAVLLPIGMAALMNNRHLRGKRIFRTLFYMPYIVPVVSAVYIWKGVLNNETGWINRFLQDVLGLSGPNWLNSPDWIYPALVIVGLWGLGNAYMITLAAMQGVPSELYEASTIDGATAWERFRHVTLPMISPVIFYNLILAVIELFRYFEIPFILKNGTGEPGDATMFFNIHFYKTTFVFFDMGYGSTLAWVLFVITLIVTILLFLTARYWVYYASEDVF